METSTIFTILFFFVFLVYILNKTIDENKTPVDNNIYINVSA